MNFHDIQLPALLTLLGLVVLVLESLRPARCVRGLGIVLSGLVGGLFCYSLTLTPSAEASMGGMYHLDAFALFFQRLFLAVTALVLLMGAEFSHRFRAGAAEFYVIVLFSAVGMLFCAAVKDFILLFVALELVTVGFYVLVSYLRGDGFALEAGMKYLVFGALASGVLVYGLAYVFGMTGSTRFDVVAAALAAPGGVSPTLGFGMVLTIVGLCFKIAAVPAHMWAPDVYQGAPTPVTAFLATGSKIAGFALLTRVLFTCFLPAQALWSMLILGLAAISLLWGNLGAIGQINLKRIFGYSSIAHAGYILIGIAAGTQFGAAAVLFYLVQYAFTNLCFFFATMSLGNDGYARDLDSLHGLHRRSPLLAAAIALPMISLAGVPPASGFIAKFMLFYAAIEKGITDPALLALVLIACVGVVISLYVYFKIIRAAYFEDVPDAPPIRTTTATRVGIVICLIVIIGAGIYPAPLWNAATAAASALGLP